MTATGLLIGGLWVMTGMQADTEMMNRTEHWRHVADLLRRPTAEVMARIMWAEARGEGLEGMTLVAHVILNRTLHPRQWSADPRDVVLQPLQFSCVNRDNSQFLKLLVVDGSDSDYLLALKTAEELLALGAHRVDPTGGATHYHAVDVHPTWADALTRTVVRGNHVFYA